MGDGKKTKSVIETAVDVLSAFWLMLSAEDEDDFARAVFNGVKENCGDTIMVELCRDYLREGR